MAGETAKAVHLQPEWLRQIPAEVRLPEGATVAHTGCGTSFHAAQTAALQPNSFAVQALEAALSPPTADILVCVSHEGETEVTIEAERAFGGHVWLVTGRYDSPLSELADEVIVCTPEIERSWCHTASYTCAVATLGAMHGDDVSRLPDAVEAELAKPATPFEQDRVLIAGAGRDWPTAQEAALKLREGAWVDAVAYQTEQLLHGFLAAVDERFRAYVLEGEWLASQRAEELVAALEKLGVETTLVPTRHPVVDIVQFQLLTLAVAEARGIDPDTIRREPGSRWADSAGSAYPN
jgi:glucosamine--fructose-6-phosphate aminotransferase (isomerizing)